MEILLVIVILILLWSRMKWRVTSMNLIYYMEKKGYKLPDKADLRECTEFVVKNSIKDLIGR